MNTPPFNPNNPNLNLPSECEIQCQQYREMMKLGCSGLGFAKYGPISKATEACKVSADVIYSNCVMECKKTEADKKK